MKKFLALFLVLIMMLSVALVACSDDTTTTDGGNQGGVEEDDDGFVSKKPNTDTNDTDDTGDTGNNGGNNGGDNGDWESANYNVYAMCKINIRAEASKSSTLKGTVEAKTALTAVEKSTDEDDCWYKVTYNNETCYVDADFVTTNSAEANFTNLEESAYFNVTVKAHGTNENPYTVNLRKLPTFDADETTTVVTKEKTDTKPMKVIGMNDTKNWYIVEYDGETYYLAVTNSTKKFLAGLPSEGGNDGPIGG